MRDLGAAVAARLGPAGDAKLPSLTREELFALADRPQLVRAEDAGFFTGLDDAGRQLVRQTAQRSLLARNLLTAPAAGGEHLDLADDLQIILAARHAPSVLVVAREPSAGHSGTPSADVEVTASGIDLHAGERAAFLLGARVLGIEAFRLVAPQLGVQVLADWLLRPDAEAGGLVGRTVEILAPAPDAGRPVPYLRALVLGDGTTWRRSVVAAGDEPGKPGEPGEPVPVDRESMAAWLGEVALAGPAPARATDRAER